MMNDELEGLQVLGFNTVEEYEDHQAFLKRCRELTEQQLAGVVTVTVDKPVASMSVFGEPLKLFDHSHIKTDSHARLFKTGWLKLPGEAAVCVAVKFASFQMNTFQERLDPVFEVRQGEDFAGYYFASAFESLCL